MISFWAFLEFFDFLEPDFDGYIFGKIEIITSFTGDIQRDEKTGLIIGAKSVQHAWITQINPDLKSGAGYGLELDLADDTSLLWEKKLIETMKEYDSSLTNLSVKISVHRR